MCTFWDSGACVCWTPARCRNSQFVSGKGPQGRSMEHIGSPPAWEVVELFSHCYRFARSHHSDVLYVQRLVNGFWGEQLHKLYIYITTLWMNVWTTSIQSMWFNVCMHAVCEAAWWRVWARSAAAERSPWALAKDPKFPPERERMREKKIWERMRKD